jgi:type II secretory pathway pseudopilin PulG
MAKSLPSRRGERGYVLLTLMLFVALLAIASLAWIQKVDFEIKRDREEELIHRGVQYSRALRHYVKKFGHYPARIEDLESTNNVHYLRKRYKDPITGKDFKFLRMNDIQSSFNPGAASGMAPGNPGSPMQGGAPGALNMSNNAGQGGPGPSSNPGGPGPNSNPGGPQDQPQSGAGDNSGSDQTAQSGAGPANTPQGPGTPANQTGPGNGQSFGGLPIVGVASTSKDKSIRAFNKKDHYNQWQFIYDPSTDRGGLLTTPNQPPLQNAVQVQQQNDQQNGNGQNQTGFSAGPGGMKPGTQAPQQVPQPDPQQPNQQLACVLAALCTSAGAFFFY